MQWVSKLFPWRVKKMLAKGDVKLSGTGVCNRRTPGVFGVEIEAEGNNLPAAVFGWDVHKEGSLRGEAKEYVTVGAVTREELDQSMELLEQVLHMNDAVVDEASYRASTHIHLNVQEYTHQEIIGVIFAFLMVEPVWMRLCGPTRDGNLFCLPSYDCGDMPMFVKSYVETLTRYGNLGNLENRGKYASLNTNHLVGGFGTLEFRTFPCSVQRNEVLKWADWCANLARWGKSIKHPGRALTEFYGNPQPFLNTVFGPQLIDRFGPVDLMSMVEVGAENTFECVRAYQHTLKQEGKKAA
jgi:hypothetical protein